MRDNFEWIIGLLTVVFGIAGIVNNNKKKREEQASSMAGRGASTVGRGSQAPGSGRVSTPGMGRAKPAGGTFGSLLEELSRQLAESEQPSPTVTSWPLSRSAESRSWEMAEVSEPEAKSHDYYSLEDMAMNDSYLRGGYDVENVDAESRYAGGELRTGEVGGKGRGGSVAVYAEVDPMADPGIYSAAEPSVNSIKSAYIQDDSGLAGDATSTTLNELLGGDFDLRRAVIESEILMPKYVMI